MFTKRLKQARKLKSMTQIELAEAVGVSQSAPSQWERGVKEPTLSNLYVIAKVLDCSPGWLLGTDSSSKPNSLNALLIDPATPYGLRDLANSKELSQALDIQLDEWVSLRSLNSPVALSRDAYVNLLLLLRAYAA